jgi:DNA (cytosine-5)-methyltransferase 1
MTRHPEIDWRVRPLPPLPDRQPKLTDILEELPSTSREWWNTKRATYLLDQMSPAHRAEANAMIQGDVVTFGTVFRRVRKGKSMAELRTNEIAGCLRTPRGGSGRQILFAAGQGKFGVRLLTPRECARLMGADDYKIEAKITKALFGFGDAVCVPVVEWIARHYLNPVLEEERRSGNA